MHRKHVFRSLDITKSVFAGVVAVGWWGAGLLSAMGEGADSAHSPPPRPSPAAGVAARSLEGSTQNPEYESQDGSIFSLESFYARYSHVCRGDRQGLVADGKPGKHRSLPPATRPHQEWTSSKSTGLFLFC